MGYFGEGITLNGFVIGPPLGGGGYFGGIPNSTVPIPQPPPPPPPPISTLYSILVGVNSNGPVGAYGGDGTGYYDGELNGGISTGAITPDPSFVAAGLMVGAFVVVTGWQGAFGGVFILAVSGTYMQTDLIAFKLGAPANLTFLQAAATFDIATAPGFSIWRWPDGHQSTFIGANLGCTLLSHP